jgi:hypothetical protein
MPPLADRFEAKVDRPGETTSGPAHVFAHGAQTAYRF